MDQSELLVRKAKLQRELERRKKSDKGIFYVNDDPILPRAVSIIEKDLREVENMLTDLGAGLSLASRPSGRRGSLKAAVQAWVEEEGFETDESVPSTKIAKFIRENLAKFPNLSEGSVRSTLSRLGYSCEKKGT